MKSVRSSKYRRRTKEILFARLVEAGFSTIDVRSRRDFTPFFSFVATTIDIYAKTINTVGGGGGGGGGHSLCKHRVPARVAVDIGDIGDIDDIGDGEGDCDCET